MQKDNNNIENPNDFELDKKGLRDRIASLTNGNAAKFAKKARIKDQTFRKYIRDEIDGPSIPTSDSLLKIAVAGGVSADWLLKGDNKTIDSAQCRLDCPFKNCSPKTFQLCRDAAEVLESKRETFSVALTSNILAFKEAVQQAEASSQQAEELDGIKARLKKLEDEKRENAPEPESDPGFPPSGDAAATAGGN